MAKKKKEDRWHKAKLEAMTVIERRLEEEIRTSLDGTLEELGRLARAKKTVLIKIKGQVDEGTLPRGYKIVSKTDDETLIRRNMIDNTTRLDAVKFLTKLHSAIPSEKIDHKVSLETEISDEERANLKEIAAEAARKEIKRIHDES